MKHKTTAVRRGGNQPAPVRSGSVTGGRRVAGPQQQLQSATSTASASAVSSPATSDPLHSPQQVVQSGGSLSSSGGGGGTGGYGIPDLSTLQPTPTHYILPSQPCQQTVAQMATAPIHQQPQQQQQHHHQQQQLHHQQQQQHAHQQHQHHHHHHHIVPSQRLIRRGHQIELLAQAKALCDNQDFVDLTIYCEDGVVRAHQMLLAVASPFLKHLFQGSPNYETEEVSLIFPEVKVCLVQALIHFVYTGTVVSKEDHFYSLMKLVYALNINASIEAESTSERPTHFSAPLVPLHSVNQVLKLPNQAHFQQQHYQYQTQQQPPQYQSPQMIQASIQQHMLPSQPVSFASSGGGGLSSAAVSGSSSAAALVAQITQPSIVPPPNKIQKITGPPSNAMPIPPQNLGLANKLPIQLPTQPVPLVNGVVKGTENQQQLLGSSLTQTQSYIAIDPTTGVSYKVDMTNGQLSATGELASSDTLASIMNETIFTDTSGAIVPAAPNAAMYTTETGQVIYTNQPPPNAIPTSLQQTHVLTSVSGGQMSQQQQQQQTATTLTTSTPTKANRGKKRKSSQQSGTQQSQQQQSAQLHQQHQSNGIIVSAINVSGSGGSNSAANLSGSGSLLNNSIIVETVDDLPCAPDDDDCNTPYPCPSCQKSIKGRVMLQAHHFQEHYENPELGQLEVGDRHACRVCLKLFTRNSDVKAHILRVHCGDRRYPCTMCGKRFKESTHLRKHLYTHTGERPHFCNLCSKGFQTSSDLKRHKRTRVHQEKVEQGGVEIDDEAPGDETGGGTSSQQLDGESPLQDSKVHIEQWSDDDEGAANVSNAPPANAAQVILNSITQPVVAVIGQGSGGPDTPSTAAGATAQVGANNDSSGAQDEDSAMSPEFVDTAAVPLDLKSLQVVQHRSVDDDDDDEVGRIRSEQQQRIVEVVPGDHRATSSSSVPRWGASSPSSSASAVPNAASSPEAATNRTSMVMAGNPLDLKDLAPGEGPVESAADADEEEMNAFIESAAAASSQATGGQGHLRHAHSGQDDDDDDDVGRAAPHRMPDERHHNTGMTDDGLGHDDHHHGGGALLGKVALNPVLESVRGRLGHHHLQHKPSTGVAGESKKGSALDSPSHDDERLTVVENADDSSQENNGAVGAGVSESSRTAATADPSSAASATKATAATSTSAT